jgi:CRISPR-associated protein Csb1
LAQIRKLSFPGEDGAVSLDRHIAGRSVIAALGLCAVTLQQEDGYQLRSRCQLVPTETPQFELIGRTGKEKETFQLDSTSAVEALALALAAAEAHGLKWNPGKIELQPRPDLLKLVAYSDRATGATEGE